MDEGDPELEEAAHGGGGPDEPELFLSGLQGPQGSTIGPDGKLYVTEGRAGTVVRIDKNNGSQTTYLSGLPQQLAAVGIGGPVDVAFVGNTAYVLVTLVGSDVGGTSAVGIYRRDSATSSTLIADIGAFSIANPPATAFFIPSGVQYALEAYKGDLLVTDGHHNRMLRVKTNGTISIVKSFDNIVPTGIETFASAVFMAQAGPVPHLPADGKVVSFVPGLNPVLPITSGAALAVDVEFGDGSLFVLSQGIFSPTTPEGGPADPNTGKLYRILINGTLSTVADELNQPTSVEFFGDDAYIVTLGGEIWTVDVD
jgi:sugar lactone lactonase YvrE